VGDGSGTGWDDYCGWGATLIERLTMCRKRFYGGMNVGSVNVAELIPYVQALLWFHTKFGEDRLKRSKGFLTTVVLSDSKYVCDTARKVVRGHRLPEAQMGLWAAIQAYSRCGYDFTWCWIPRETLALNWAADRMAGLSRRAIKELQLVDDAGDPLSPYNFNP